MASPFKLPAGYGGNSTRFAPRFLPSTGQTGTILSTTWDFAPIIKLAARISGEFYNADPAIRAAHLSMAQWVAHYQQQVLINAVRTRGREQKSTLALVGAIGDNKTYDVNLRGFTNGYLNRIKEVDLYWRRIEEGSATQVGQVFYGAFLNKDGRWSWPSREHQTDLRLIKFGAFGPLQAGGTYTSHAQRALEGTEGGAGKTPVVTIGKAIPAYQFLSKGFAEWLTKEGKFSSVLGEYAQAFAENAGRGGISFFDRWARRYGAHKPGSAAALIVKGYGSSS